MWYSTRSRTSATIHNNVHKNQVWHKDFVCTTDGDRLYISPENATTVFIYLTDVNVDNATEFFVGHRGSGATIKISGKRGTVIAFNCKTLAHFSQNFAFALFVIHGTVAFKIIKLNIAIFFVVGLMLVLGHQNLQNLLFVDTNLREAPKIDLRFHSHIQVIMSTECPICAELFTSTVRKPIPCVSCNYSACMACVKRYLINTPADPNCMSCHYAWNREFIDTHLTRSWREGELKKHRAERLFDQERSLLPSSQNAVAIFKAQRAAQASLAGLMEEREKRLRAVAEIEEEIHNAQIFIKHGKGSQQFERRKFIAACPDAKCRGFMSTAYKCGTCEVQFCADCREKKMDDHMCDPDLVKTIATIVSQSHNCPKCGTAISKVDGCDQMYCTQCDTAFSWKTGQIIVGAIHNPHYYERLRAGKLRVGAPASPAAPGCAAFPGLHELPQELHYNMFLSNYYRVAMHVEHVVLAREMVATPPDNTDLRVLFLLNELDEPRFKTLLQQRDRKYQRILELRPPLELFVITAMEYFIDMHAKYRQPRRAVLDNKDIIKDIATISKHIETHVNAPLIAIGQRYKNAVPHFNIAAFQGRYGKCYGQIGWKSTQKEKAED